MLARFTLSLLALSVGFAAQAASFNNTYFFGDSLSDSGVFGFKFTVNPGPVWSEVVAGAYGGRALPNAGTGSGNNYAQGGARVKDPRGYGSTPFTQNATPVSGQLSSYFNQHNGAADPNALHGVWAGSNDIFFQLTDASATPDTITANVAQSSRDLVEQIQRLRASGARHILVLNLPNLGDTLFGQTSGVGPQLNSLTRLYNTTLFAGLRNANVPVIFLDINAFTSEISANPTAYGVVKSTVPACTNPSGTVCTGSTLVVPDAGDTFFFSDGIHPTPGAHRLIAQYATAVIDAPQQMAQLPNVALRNAQALKHVLDDRLTLLRTRAAADDGEQGEHADFFFNLGASDADQNAVHGSPSASGHNRQITLGWDKHFGQGDFAGLALAYSDGSHDFSGDRGGFDLRDTSITLYGGKTAGGYYVQGYGQFAAQSYADIQRRIRLGMASRVETSEAKGTRLGAGFTAGYNWTLGGFQTGPLLGLDGQHLRVDDFHEDGNGSTTMAFSEQKRRSLLGSLGWSLEGAIGDGARLWRPFAQVSYKHEFKDDEREVTAGLVAAPARFTMPAGTPDSNFVDYRLGLAADFKGWKGALSFAASSGLSDGDYRVYNLTVGSTF